MRTETKVLIAMRNSLDLTQAQLAKALGYTTSQFVSNWERGKCGIAVDALKIIRKKFGEHWVDVIISAKVKDFEQQLRGLK